MKAIRSISRRMAIAAVAALVGGSCSCATAGFSDAHGRVSPAEALFPLSAVRLDGGPLKWQQEQNRRYLLRLDPDRLLSRFRSEAGLKPKAPSYGGWENSRRGKYPLDLPGHILGFYMSGAAMTVEATGDEELKRRLLYIVDELDEVQNAHGDGYLLPTRNGRKVFSEIVSGDIRLYLYDRRGTCGHINGCFAPVYVANKILLGLWRIRIATGSDKAWKVLLRFSDWLGANVVDKLDDAALQRMLVCEQGSIPETFVYAFAATGDAKYRRWAERLLHREPIDALAAGKKDDLVYRHGNLTIPKFTSAERISRMTGDAALHRAAVNAWDAIVQDHTWANGANAHHEHWFPKNEFEEKLYKGKLKDGPESCNSVNMLRLTEALFETEPDADKMDYYECVLFNHLLSTHEPVLGRTAYITPLWPGASRSYSHEFDSMWCCTGTGFEAPGKYAQMVYTRSADGGSVRVNLFAPSTLDWAERGVRLRQETAFPYGESARIRVEAAGANPKFTVLVRRPAWAKDGFAVYVDGQSVRLPGAGASYVPIARKWKAGDCIDIDFPMSLWAKPLPGSDRYVAFFYGPLLLAADYGTAGRSPRDYIANPADTTRHTWRFSPVEKMPVVPAAAAQDPSCCLERTTGGAAAFHLKGGDTLLMPMCDLHFRRYNVYWMLGK